VRIRYPDGTEVAGAILDVDPPRRLAFTYGYVKGTPIPPGASVVTIQLERHEAGTRLSLTHEFADAAVRDEHVQGWRYQLALFSNVVSDEVNADVGHAVDRWFAVWSEPDQDERARVLTEITLPSVTFRDRYGHTDGLGDLMPHVSAAQRFMPGIRLERRGEVRQCQGVALADWVAVSPDGQERASGTSVFNLDSTGRIQSVTGLWTPPRKAPVK
jgi:hypothetical protein